VLITIGSYENYGRLEFSECHIGLVMNEVKLVDKWVIITRKLDRGTYPRYDVKRNCKATKSQLAKTANQSLLTILCKG
jgi:hypothetical protein